MSEAIAKGFIGVVIFALLVVTTVWWAFAFVTAWQWLVVPQFNAPSLTMMQALTISLFKTALFASINRDPEWGEAITYSVVGPTVLLLFAFIYSFFI